MSEAVLFPLGELLEAKFIQRDNRFRAEVEVNGEPVKVHVPNSGRMKELLVPGASVWIQPAAGEHRKTAYTLLLVQQGDGFVVSFVALAPAHRDGFLNVLPSHEIYVSHLTDVTLQAAVWQVVHDVHDSYDRFVNLFLLMIDLLFNVRQLHRDAGCTV